MDSCEATKMVFSRIQNLDPENVSKIMGYLLLQDYGDKEMIRLAFGPEILLHNLILQAKTQLGIFASNLPSTPSSRSNPLSISFSRITTNNGGFDNIPNPSSPSSNSWPLLSPSKSTSSFSYASIVNGTCNSNTGSASLSNAFPCYNSSSSSNNNSTNNSNTNNDPIDDYHLQDQLSFFNDAKTDDLFDQRAEFSLSPTAHSDFHLHRRSFSVPGMCFGSEDLNSGLGWKPCLYFARGFCKNGNGCRFLHGEADFSGSAAPIVGSPSKMNEFEQCQELLRSKAVTQQQKLAAAAAASQFMGGASFPYNKSMNFLFQQQNDIQRSAATSALMMGDELHKFGRCRSERNDFSPMGLGGAMNPGSRQIYLTFPADSTFREEDVSNYFSIYGPVQDVRIPYQQKRMFGFVTFLYPETVKIILAKGNPHFVCDSRVLVKPYKEKGKIAEKKLQLQQQMERGDYSYSACPSPTAIDSREQFDLHFAGARMFYNAQEILLRRKLEEQADLQQASELQGRRLMNLQLLDLKTHIYNPHQHLHGLSAGSPISSPTLSRPPIPINQSIILSPDVTKNGDSKENGGDPDAAVSGKAAADASQEVYSTCQDNGGNNNNKCNEEQSPKTEESDLHESLEHILPDSLFTSPKKSAGDHLTVFSTASVEVDENETSPSSSSSSSSNNNPPMSTTSALDAPSLKSCFLPMPRLPSGHGAIGI